MQILVSLASLLWRQRWRGLSSNQHKHTRGNCGQTTMNLSQPLVFLLPLSIASIILPIVSSTTATPTPTPWPHQFHSILFMNYSGSLQMIDLWYDWTNGRNFNIIRDQLGSKILYDLEWNNGTSFFYTLDSSRECRSVQLEVGILRPNWLDGANYLGQRVMDGFLCNVWEKVDFIWYYEDVVYKRPVLWVFYTGRQAHVMTFEVGAALEDAKWQAPVYCFDKKNKSLSDHPSIVPSFRFHSRRISKE